MSLCKGKKETSGTSNAKVYVEKSMAAITYGSSLKCQ